jgi:hypothetical protein
MVHQIGGRLREQIHSFSGKLCTGLGKVASRFVEEMVYGIQARGSVRLSETARSLEEKTSVRKRIDRLSRNLGRKGLSDHIGDAVLSEGAKYVAEDTLLIIDPTDIRKPYAKRMEHLARIRDASEKEIGMGYWVDIVVAARNGGHEIVPLVCRLYSQVAEEFVSENHELLEAMGRVYKATEGRGVFVMDRGGDRRRLYRRLLGSQMPCRFIIRQRGDRHLLYKGKLRETLELAHMCKTPFRETVVKEKDGREKVYQIDFGFLPVRLVDHKDRPLWLVVIKGFGAKPLMLLTTEPMRRNRSVVWWPVQAYLTRWRVEDTIRFIKQSYKLEDIRVRRYQCLKNMAALVLAASFFAAVHIGFRHRMEILALHALKAAKRIFGIPDFRYYALAHGIREILSRCGRGIAPRKPLVGGTTAQLDLFIT